MLSLLVCSKLRECAKPNPCTVTQALSGGPRRGHVLRWRLLVCVYQATTHCTELDASRGNHHPKFKLQGLMNNIMDRRVYKLCVVACNLQYRHLRVGRELLA